MEIRECKYHGLTEFVLENDNTKYRQLRCKKCRAAAVTKRRRKVKELLVREAGGKCFLCGYDRYFGALDFHHKRPKEKSFGLSEGGISRSFQKSLAEIQKCVLLCANCHREVEAGILTI
jgi:5-methylcytosine-specific restriction endonuclease McrA